MDLLQLKEGDYVKIITKENKKYFGFVYLFKNTLFVKTMPLVVAQKEFKLTKTKCRFQKHKFFLFKKLITNFEFNQNYGKSCNQN
jgi:hypothetical protein